MKKERTPLITMKFSIIPLRALSRDYSEVQDKSHKNVGNVRIFRQKCSLSITFYHPYDPYRYRNLGLNKQLHNLLETGQGNCYY
jgi:hypothetical protein